MEGLGAFLGCKGVSKEKTGEGVEVRAQKGGEDEKGTGKVDVSESRAELPQWWRRRPFGARPLGKQQRDPYRGGSR